MKQTIIHKICKAISSLGPIGYLPASGTWGSLVALPFAWLLAGTPWLFLLTFFSFIVGILTIRPLIAESKEKDPSFVIIDEFMGQLIVFFTIERGYMTPVSLIFGFLFFRLFDILKPWPASFLDRKVHSSFGVMMDDLMAALYAMISLAFMETISYYL